MKVGLLTFPNSPSYGASLQMFALYQAVSKLGADVEVINYINLYMKNKQHYAAGNASSLRKGFSKIVELPIRMKFSSFEKQMKMYPRKPLHLPEELVSLADRYDYMVCGSDQVWNPKVTGGDWSYLFSFCKEDRKKIAYAPSFGVSELPDELKETYETLLNKFQSLSVREVAGRQIIQSSTGRECPVVLDPSMLLTKEQWEQQCKPLKGLPEHYIAPFIFNKNENTDRFIRDLQEKTGLPIVGIGGHALTRIRHKNFTGPVGPAQWLSVIKNADYVITDSFHGAAFSIIFEKELFVSLASATNSRLVTLMDTFGLNDRIIRGDAVENVRKIDYDNVASIMRKKREFSLNYLRQALEISRDC